MLEKITNIIFNEDNKVTMSRMLPGIIDGIITSPPFNFNRTRSDCYYNNGYSDIDNLPDDEYLKLRVSEFREFSRIVREDGVICYNLSYHHRNPMLPILLIAKVHDETEWTLADIITWKKRNAIPFQTSPTKLSRICEFVFVLAKKQRLHDFRTNKAVSKINKKTRQCFYKNYVNFIEAPNNDGIKSPLKASYSTKLVERLIDIYFPPESIIYDPFMGTGATARACMKTGRKFVGSEIKREFFELCPSLEPNKTQT